MQCPVCGHSMIALFLSYVCDYCERSPAPERMHGGYVVWSSTQAGERQYVFPTRAAAERWRELRGLQHCEVRRVLSAAPFKWRISTGSVKGLEFADHLFEIFPDHRFKPGPYRAYIAS